jgi:hypothetical protein
MGNRYACIPGWAAACKQLAASDWRVFVAIAQHADRDGRLAFPALKTIAGLAGIDRTKVPRSIRRIEAAGLLRVHRRKVTHGFFDVNLYEVVFDRIGVVPTSATPAAVDGNTIVPDLGTLSVAVSGTLTDQFLTDPLTATRRGSACEGKRVNRSEYPMGSKYRRRHRPGGLLDAALGAVEAARRTEVEP